MAGRLCAVLLWGAASGAASWAAGVAGPDVSGTLLRQNEIQMMENRLQRQQFQQDQQLRREWDRQAVPAQPVRPDVPIMKPRCPAQVFGNTYAVPTGCR